MRRYLNWSVYLVFSLLLLSIMDSCSGMLESRTMFRLVRGVARPLSGDLDTSSIKDLERLAGVKPDDDLNRYLTYEVDGPIFLQFISLKGRLWRGELSAPDYAEPGEYHLLVYQKGIVLPTEARRLKVMLYPDMDSYMRSLPSITERLFGFQAWWVTLAAMPLGLLLFYLSYRQSDEDDEILRSQGLATIFKLARKPEGWDMAFSLGSRDGLADGDTLYILDRKRRQIGSFHVDSVAEEYSIALLPLTTPIKANCLISLRPLSSAKS